VSLEMARAMPDWPSFEFGSARQSLEKEEDIQRAMKNISDNFGALVVIGGNDHLYEGRKLAKLVKERRVDGKKIDCTVIGVPKTIDADTLYTKPLGAEFAGQKLNEYVYRAAARPGSGEVIIIEAMGRDCGFLAARAGDVRMDKVLKFLPKDLRKRAMEVAPTMETYVPEYPVRVKEIQRRVKEKMNKVGGVTIILSEGLRLRDDDAYDLRSSNRVLDEIMHGRKPDKHGNLVIPQGIAAEFMAEILKDYNPSLEIFGFTPRGALPVKEEKVMAAEFAKKVAQAIVNRIVRIKKYQRGEGVAVTCCDDLRASADELGRIEVMPFSKACGKDKAGKSKGKNLKHIISKEEAIRAGVVIGQGQPISAVSRHEPVSIRRKKNRQTVKEAAAATMISAGAHHRVSVFYIGGVESETIVNHISGSMKYKAREGVKYVSGRTQGSTLILSGKNNMTLTELLRESHRIIDGMKKAGSKFFTLNIFVSKNFKIDRKDPMLRALAKQREALGQKIKDTLAGKKYEPPIQSSQLSLIRQINPLMEITLMKDSIDILTKQIAPLNELFLRLESLDKNPQDIGNIVKLILSTATLEDRKPFSGVRLTSMSRSLDDEVSVLASSSASPNNNLTIFNPDSLPIKPKAPAKFKAVPDRGLANNTASREVEFLERLMSQPPRTHIESEDQKKPKRSGSEEKVIRSGLKIWQPNSKDGKEASSAVASRNERRRNKNSSLLILSEQNLKVKRMSIRSQWSGEKKEVIKWVKFNDSKIPFKLAKFTYGADGELAILELFRVMKEGKIIPRRAFQFQATVDKNSTMRFVYRKINAQSRIKAPYVTIFEAGNGAKLLSDYEFRETALNYNGKRTKTKRMQISVAEYADDASKVVLQAYSLNGNETGEDNLSSASSSAIQTKDTTVKSDSYLSAFGEGYENETLLVINGEVEVEIASVVKKFILGAGELLIFRNLTNTQTTSSQVRGYRLCASKQNAQAKVRQVIIGRSIRNPADLLPNVEANYAEEIFSPNGLLVATIYRSPELKQKPFGVVIPGNYKGLPLAQKQEGPGSQRPQLKIFNPESSSAVTQSKKAATVLPALKPVYHLTLNNHQPAGTEWSLRHYFESYLPILAALALPREDWNRIFPQWKNVDRSKLKLNYSISLSLSRELQEYTRSLVELVRNKQFDWNAVTSRKIEQLVERSELPQEIGLILKPAELWSDEDVKFVHTYFNFKPPHEGSITRTNNLCPQYKKIWPAFAQFYDECWSAGAAGSMPWGGFVHKDFRDSNKQKPSAADKVTAKALLLGIVLVYFNRHLFAKGAIRLAGIIHNPRYYQQYPNDNIIHNKHKNRTHKYFERPVDFSRFLNTEDEDKKVLDEKERNRTDKKQDNHFIRLAKNQKACVDFAYEMTKALTIFPNLVALLSISDELAEAAQKGTTPGAEVARRTRHGDGEFFRNNDIGRISFSVTPHIIAAALMDQREAMIDEHGLQADPKEAQDKVLAEYKPWLYYHEKPLNNPKFLSNKFQRVRYPLNRENDVRANVRLAKEHCKEVYGQKHMRWVWNAEANMNTAYAKILSAEGIRLGFVGFRKDGNNSPAGHFAYISSLNKLSALRSTQPVVCQGMILCPYSAHSNSKENGQKYIDWEGGAYRKVNDFTPWNRLPYKLDDDEARISNIDFIEAGKETPYQEGLPRAWRVVSEFTDGENAVQNYGTGGLVWLFKLIAMNQTSGRKLRVVTADEIVNVYERTRRVNQKILFDVEKVPFGNWSHTNQLWIAGNEAQWWLYYLLSKVIYDLESKGAKYENPKFKLLWENGVFRAEISCYPWHLYPTMGLMQNPERFANEFFGHIAWVYKEAQKLGLKIGHLPIPEDWVGQDARWFIQLANEKLKTVALSSSSSSAATEKSAKYLPPVFAGNRIMGGFLPLFSVRSKTGQGTGNIEHLYKTVELYQKLGWNALQVLPMNLCNMNSPYSPESSRLMDWMYNSVDILLGRSAYSRYDSLVIDSPNAVAYLGTKNTKITSYRGSKEVEYHNVRPVIYQALKLIWKDFQNPRYQTFNQEFAAYKEKNKSWLTEHIIYILLKQKFMQKGDPTRDWDWRRWPQALSARDKAALADAEEDFRKAYEYNECNGKTELIDLIEFHSFMQWVFYRQWMKFLAFAHQNNIGIIGDMPFGLDGAELWINQNVFDYSKNNVRHYTQGWVVDEFSDYGQDWQLTMYAWNKPQTIDFMVERFKYLLDFCDYIRLDCFQGYYQLFRFKESIGEELSLKSLGIWDQMSEMLSNAKTKTQKQIGEEVYQLIAQKLYSSEHLSAEDKAGLFNKQGRLSSKSIFYVVRKSEADLKPDLKRNGWGRFFWVERKALRDEPWWDFNPFSVKKYRRGYLFPANKRLVPRPTDQIRFAYRYYPHGESVIVRFLDEARKQKKVVIAETFEGPKFMQESLNKLTEIMPYVSGQLSGNNAHKFQEKISKPWVMAVHSLHDLTTMEGKKATGSDLPTKNVSPELAAVTMSDQERMQLLSIPAKAPASLFVLYWPDWGKWPGPWTERITNVPGNQLGDWVCRMPRKVTLEDLLLAVDGKTSNRHAKGIVQFLQKLTRHSGRGIEYQRKQGAEIQASSAASAAIDYLSPVFTGNRIMGGYLPLFSVKSKTGQGIGNIEHLYKMTELYNALGWNVLQVPPMNLSSMGVPYSLKSTRLMDWGYASLDLLLGRSDYGKDDEFWQELKNANINLSQVEGYLNQKQKEIGQLRDAKITDHPKARSHIKEGFELAWQAFKKIPEAHPARKSFNQYKQKNPWLSDHILFVLMEEKYGAGYKWLTGWDFRNWYPELSKYPQYRQTYISGLKQKLNKEIEFHSFMQYVFWRQWQSFLKFSHQRNVGIIGDMPWASDGADIWINQNMFGVTKGAKRRYTQALPPDDLHDCGQCYQMHLYNWKNPGAIEYFIDRFRYLTQFYDYVRLDFARGAYRLYRFFEDPSDNLTLEKLGIMKQDGSWRDEAFAARLQNAQHNINEQLEVAKDLYWAILKALYESKGLSDEDKTHFFNAYKKEISEGYKKGLTQDGTIYVARPAQINGENFKANTHTNGWERIKYVVERDMTAWDLLPVRQGSTRVKVGSQDVEVRYEFDFLRKYLFPEDQQHKPKAQDGLRIGYFVKSPGEKLMSGLLRVAQENGKVLISELLGMMPEQKLDSIHSLAGAMNYAPGIFLDTKDDWVKRKQIYRPWSMATYSTHDTINLEGGKATSGFKGIRDEGLKVIGKEALRNITLSDIERHKLLNPIIETPSLLSILMWVDWGNWPGPWTERITNISGTTSSENWVCRMPIPLEDLLAAAKNQNASNEAKGIIKFLRDLPQRKVKEVKAASLPELISTFPAFGHAKQQRFIDKGEKFEVWAFINGKAQNVKLFTGGHAYTMQPAEVTSGLPKEIMMYSASVEAKQFQKGKHEFRIQIDGKIQKGKGILQATTSTNPELNRVKVPLRTEEIPILSSSAVTDQKISRPYKNINYLSPIFSGKRIMGGLLPLFSVRTKTGQGVGSIEDYYKMVELYQKLGWNVLQIPPMNLSNMDCPYSVESSRLMDWLYISLDMLLGKSSYRKFDGLSIRSKSAKE
ncbi:MAG: 4-alpha-glucanotransferase, partial [Candidatus Omnitrophota bacterium]